MSLLGPSWAALGVVLGALGAVLGPSGAPLGPLLGHLGDHRSKETGAFFPAPPSGPEKSPLGPLLGRSWGALGRSWAVLGPLLGPSWGPRGQSWSHLEASEAHRKRKGDKANTIDFLQAFEGGLPLGGLLGPSWGCDGASWRHGASYIASSRVILSNIGGHLGFSEPSWSHLGQFWTICRPAGRPVQAQGRE